MLEPGGLAQEHPDRERSRESSTLRLGEIPAPGRLAPGGEFGLSRGTTIRGAAGRSSLPKNSPGGWRAAASEAAPPAAERAWVYEAAKRTIDVVACLAALILLAPLLAIIGFLIWREDGGPVLYSQMRVGRYGRPFKFYKFRSMVPGADGRKAELAHANEATGPIFKMRDDPRVTRIGRVLRRYSLDELPQLLNVLRGDMSLVGPRPHLPAEIERCPDYPLEERQSVAPGVLCLREVQGRSRLSFDRWLELDLHYVRRRSLAMDLWILMRAVPAVLRADGAF